MYLGLLRVVCSNELDFEPIGVDQVGGVRIRAASMRVLLGEELVPAVGRRILDKFIEPRVVADMESQVVETSAGALMLTGGHVRGLFDHDVRHPQTPAVPAGPVLERLVAQLTQQPTPLGSGAVNLGNPQFDVMHCSSE